MKLGSNKQRTIRNFLLQPLLQIKLGLYCIGLSLAYALIVGSLLYRSFFRFYDLILELTDLKEEIADILYQYVAASALWLAGASLLYLLVTVVISITYTHSLIGPTYAFRRHIASLLRGEYGSRIVLRKGDAFNEVAAELNQLAEVFEKRYGSVPPKGDA